MSVEENANDTTSEPSNLKKKCKKGSGATDIFTVFKLIDADDLLYHVGSQRAHAYVD